MSDGDDYRESVEGGVPVVYCERQKKWLPVEEHLQCEYSTGEVFDECGDPVSFICTFSEECKVFQPKWEDEAEIGRGPPLSAEEPDEEEEE